MGSKNQVTLTFAGDEEKLNKSFRSVGDASDRFGRNVGKASKQAGSDFDRMGNKADGTKGKFAGLGTSAGMLTGAIGAIGGSVALSAFTSLTDKAKDAGETFSKASTIFGDGFGDIQKWAETSTTSLGMSKTAALDAASSYGNLFLQLKFSKEEATSMSKSMVGLATDFASFHNKDITEVIEAQSAAFRGEYDSLQKFVPTISAATVEQKALTMTGKKLTSELSAQEKAAAVAAFMMENAGKAQGDFARTSGSAANQSKIANAEMENMNEMIGTKLLPVQQKWTEAKMLFANLMVDKVLPALDKMGKFVAENQGPFTVLAVIIGGVLTAAFLSWAAGAAVAAVATIAATWPLLAIGAAVALLAFIVIKNWDTIKEWTVKIFSAVWGFIKTVFNIIMGLFKFYIGIYVTIFKGIWTGAQWVWNKIREAASAVFGAIGGIISGFKDRALGIMRSVPGAVKGILGGVGDAITAPFRTGFNGIKLAWNKAVGGKGFSVPDWVPGVGGKSFRIPKLAKGGIVTEPTLALIGEAGPEKVTPLDGKHDGGPTTIEIKSGGSRLDDLLVELLRKSIKAQGGNVQVVLGA